MLLLKRNHEIRVGIDARACIDCVHSFSLVRNDCGSECSKGERQAPRCVILVCESENGRDMRSLGGWERSSWAVFKEASMCASIESCIFETGTRKSGAKTAPDSQNFVDSTSGVMLAMPSNVVVRSPLVQSKCGTEVCSYSSLLTHSSRLPNSLAKRVSVHNEDKTNNSVKRFRREELDFGIDATAVTNFHRHDTTHHNRQGQVLGIESVVGHEGFTLAVSRDDSPPGKHLSDGTARTQDLGVAVSVEWPYLPHHQCKCAQTCTRERDRCRRKGNQSGWSLAYKKTRCILSRSH